MAGDPARQDGSSGAEPRERMFAPVRLESQGPSIGRWIAIVGFALVVVVAKPWAAGEPSAGQAGPAGPPTVLDRRDDTSFGSTSATGPTAKLSDSPPAAFCGGPGTWLVATVERWRTQTIRVWRAADPIEEASGPEDEDIPMQPLGVPAVLELGWCAPIEGPERLIGPVEVHVWRERADGRWDEVDISEPVMTDSALGALYRPPGRRQAYWREGAYVIRIREANQREHWLGVEFERRQLAL
jgi:hypothetical protein